eukprot:CAMPEP_0118657294 /NCGR_PEP_ID=MMETSP0785-20121206/13943_1 /TAXON_ID=91992 /ORGANISM="Bolidomonas pacifica, Strain CCMP 1866" /LENGTH=92 /DNA_ID=CAMNT_0006550205 /DNA_START=262 /DNA_END=540 /DNA_ORIENTATION=-
MENMSIVPATPNNPPTIILNITEPTIIPRNNPPILIKPTQISHDTTLLYHNSPYHLALDVVEVSQRTIRAARHHNLPKSFILVKHGRQNPSL